MSIDRLIMLAFLSAIMSMFIGMLDRWFAFDNRPRLSNFFNGARGVILFLGTVSCLIALFKIIVRVE